MSLKAKWKHIPSRDWSAIKDNWLAHVPNFPAVGSMPDPGLERLSPLLSHNFENDYELVTDVPGLRSNALWEGVFLFHKCSHAELAAQRLANGGMTSWSLFNAYHAAYLGARGIMNLLGVCLPNLAGRQLALDLFPENSRATKKPRGSPVAPGPLVFNAIKLPMLDQRYVWEGFQRLIRVSKNTPFDARIIEDILGLDWERITPPRNHFLYKAQYWPLGDIITDSPSGTTNGLLPKREFGTDDDGFLLSLSFAVYFLFEALIKDIADQSSVIKRELLNSRCVASMASGTAECAPYELYRSYVV